MSFKRDLALVGIGHWGKNLARNFNQLNALHTVCDAHANHLSQCQKIYPRVSFTETFDTILQNPEIKKVVIAVPTAFHYQFAKQALEQGKDVFVEKAMSSDAGEAFELYTIAKEKNQILMVGHILHYHPCIERIKEMIQTGDLGELLHLQFNRLNFGSRGPETSALWAFAPHDISILLSFCQSYLLETVQCTQQSFYSNDHFDQSWISLNFSQNVKASIHVSWMNPVPERRLTIVGTKGTLVFDDLKDWGEKLTFWENSVSRKGSYLQFNQRAEERIRLESKEPLQEECKHFLDCCKNRSVPITSGLEGFQVMKVLDLASKSSRLNKTLNYEEYSREPVTL